MTSEQDDAQPTATAGPEDPVATSPEDPTPEDPTAPQEETTDASEDGSSNAPRKEIAGAPGSDSASAPREKTTSKDRPASAPQEDLPPSYVPERRPDPSEDREEPDTSVRRRRRGRRGSFLIPFVAILVLMALIKTFVVQYFEIPSGSMESTLTSGDRVAVTMYDSDDVERGDIVVFRDPDHWLNTTDPGGLKGLIRDGLILIRILPEDSGHHLIKRVIGMPGDRVVSDGQGTVSVNGVVLNETYVKKGVSPSEIAFDVTVPPGMVWVMGDNRSYSADSRLHMDDVHGGFVPLDNVVGVAKYIIWPVSRWESLGEGESVFANVPSTTS